MPDTRIFTCILCPNGCAIETVATRSDSILVSGNRCARGKAYVLQELTDPRRTIATTVPIANAELPLCSVRLTNAIPKREIFQVMRALQSVRLTAPAHIGDVVVHRVCGLDSDVIVTKDMEAR